MIQDIRSSSALTEEYLEAHLSEAGGIPMLPSTVRLLSWPFILRRLSLRDVPVDIGPVAMHPGFRWDDMLEAIAWLGLTEILNLLAHRNDTPLDRIVQMYPHVRMLLQDGDDEEIDILLGSPHITTETALRYIPFLPHAFFHGERISLDYLLRYEIELMDVVAFRLPMDGIIRRLEAGVLAGLASTNPIVQEYNDEGRWHEILPPLTVSAMMRCPSFPPDKRARLHDMGYGLDGEGNPLPVDEVEAGNREPVGLVVPVGIEALWLRFIFERVMARKIRRFIHKYIIYRVDGERGEERFERMFSRAMGDGFSA